MKQLFTFLFLALSFVLIGCEKNIANEEQEDKNSPVNIEEMKKNALTVEQAIATEGGLKIVVKGYIVAAAETSMKKADFKKPFEGSTALVLASRKSDGSSDQFFSEELIPICLTDAAKGLRDTYNLEENNQYWNNFVYVIGTRKEYMNVPGIKKVQSIVIDYDYNPNNDEETEESNSTNEDDQPINNEDPNNSDGETINGEPVYTVSQAIASGKQDNMFVKGYLIATTKQSLKNMDFTAPFENFTAIVLADEPADSPEMIQKYKDNYNLIMPIGLNVEDRSFPVADYHNKMVIVYGYLKKYMGQAGMNPGFFIEL